MDKFEIGNVVQITGPVMTGIVGIVVAYNAKREKYLVRVTEQLQNYFKASDLKLY